MVISITKLSKKFKKEVLRDVNLIISENEILGIAGISGSGKTTLLRILLRYLNSDSGHIDFENYTKRDFGFATQDHSFYDDLSVNENIFFFGRIHNVNSQAIKQRSKKLLATLGMLDEQNKLAKNLSGGMARRLDLAIALIHDPKILVCDEPTEGLDPLMRKQIWDLLLKLKNEGKTIIIASHLLNELERICNKVAILHCGSIAIVFRNDDYSKITINNPIGQLEHIKKLIHDLDPLAKIIISKDKWQIEMRMQNQILRKLLNLGQFNIEISGISLSSIFEELNEVDF